MPLIGLLHLLIAMGFAAHVMKTGRPQFWMFIILMLPLVGSVAYVLLELVPELGNTRRARRIAGSIGDIVDPDREWRRRHEAATDKQSVDTKLALAEECERKGMWGEAIQLYETAARGVFADDPALLYGMARAQFSSGDPRAAEDTLDRLRQAHPSTRHQEAHLLYVRTLEAQDRIAEAKEEYEALSRYYVGFEARTRYGLLLLRIGEPNRARALFEDVVKAGSTRRVTVLEADRDWLKVAKANL